LFIDKEYQKPKNLKEINSSNKRKKLFSDKFEHKSGKKIFTGKFAQTQATKLFSGFFWRSFFEGKFLVRFLPDFSELCCQCNDMKLPIEISTSTSILTYSRAAILTRRHRTTHRIGLPHCYRLVLCLKLCGLSQK
jgi:hypothetical protein